jgi:hypothetical protein
VAKSADLQTISINLPRPLVKRLQAIKFHKDISVSSIIEQSVVDFLGDMTEDDAGEALRIKGASLRRASG